MTSINAFASVFEHIYPDLRWQIDQTESYTVIDDETKEEIIVPALVWVTGFFPKDRLMEDGRFLYSRYSIEKSTLDKFHETGAAKLISIIVAEISDNLLHYHCIHYQVSFPCL